MMKLAVFFFLGVTVGVAGSWQFLSQHGHYERGRRQGEIMTKLALVETIKSLGMDYQRADGRNTVFTVKDVEAVAVERNGVKTLRLYDPSAN